MTCRLPMALAFLAASAVPAAAQDLWSVWGSGESDVWAAGMGATALHFDGRSWTPVSWQGAAGPAGPTREMVVGAIAGSGPGDFWAIGQRTEGEALAARWNGTQWQLLAPVPEGTGALVGLAGVSPRDIVTLDPGYDDEDTTFVLRWNGSAWSRTPLPFAIIPAGVVMVGTQIWVAGYAWRDPRPDVRNQFGVLAKLIEGRWTLMGYNGRLRTDTMIGSVSWSRVSTASGRVLLAGERTDANGNVSATVRMLTAGVWRSLGSPAPEDGNPPTHVFLLGDGSPVALYAIGSKRWNGTRWEPFAPGLTDPGTGRPTPVYSPRSPWSPPGASFAYLVVESRVVRLEAGSMRVVADARCFGPTAASTNRAMCQALGGGPVAGAPPVAAQSVGPAPVAVPSGKGRAPPSGLPRPARP